MQILIALVQVETPRVIDKVPKFYVEPRKVKFPRSWKNAKEWRHMYVNKLFTVAA